MQRCIRQSVHSIRWKHPVYSRSCRLFFTRIHKLKSKTPKQNTALDEENLFHPLSSSPFPDLRARAQAIKHSSRCPVCVSQISTPHENQKETSHRQVRSVEFDCPDCGYPTHCSEEHWRMDWEHRKYCGNLRQVNEDDHDLRRGRQLVEYELPGAQGYEAALSFANWDIFWYTRGFRSMDTERMRRHATKLLTYPITIGSILHQHSNITTRNQRLTPEGARSLAALRATVHVPSGTPETAASSINKPPVRIFVLGARAESALPPHVWAQLCYLFPSAIFQIYFIGPQVALPKVVAQQEHRQESKSSATDASADGQPSGSESKATKVYEPLIPKYIENENPTGRMRRLRSLTASTGIPSYRFPYSPLLSLIALRSSYTQQIHEELGPFDPYTDLFVLFSPGLGFPSPTTSNLLQISAPGEWGGVLPMLLATRCPIFVTGLSPADVERDVKALDETENVAGEFDWIVMPGKNEFGSEKWEVADFDVRVAVKLNWGLWSIRGKTREVRETRPT